MIKETMLHLDSLTNSTQSESFLAQLAQLGAQPALVSAKPQLLFVRFDSARATPRTLVDEAKRAGIRARVVDL